MRKDVWRKESVALLALAALILFGFGCGKKTENSANETGTYKKALNAADEAAAVRSLQTIFRAETQYMTIHSGNYGTFDELVADGSLDERFKGSAPTLEGYTFTLRATPDSGQGSAYTVNADPKDGAAGRHLYMDSASNVVRANATRPATASDPPLQP